MKKITLISIFTIIIIALFVIVLTACDNAVASISNSFYSIESGTVNNPSDITRYEFLVDSKTGVEYFYTWSGYKSAMTPRYNADGSLCVHNGGAEG